MGKEHTQVTDTDHKVVVQPAYERKCAYNNGACRDNFCTECSDDSGPNVECCGYFDKCDLPNCGFCSGQPGPAVHNQLYCESPNRGDNGLCMCVESPVITFMDEHIED